MSWKRVDSTADVEYSFSSSWSLDIPSSGPEVGDLAVLSFTTWNYLRTVNSEPDWTKVYQNNDDAILQAVYWKVLESDDLGSTLSWTFSGSAYGNASLSFYRYRTDATVSLVDWSLNTRKTGIGYTQPNTPGIDITNDRQLLVVLQTQNDVILTAGCYLRESDGAWPDAGEGDDVEMSTNVFVDDDPYSRSFDYYTINDESSPSVSGTYYTWSVSFGAGDDWKAAALVFEHSDSAGEDPTMGYGNNVFGVDSGDIGEVFGVDTADIEKVFGV